MYVCIFICVRTSALHLKHSNLLPQSILAMPESPNNQLNGVDHPTTGTCSAFPLDSRVEYPKRDRCRTGVGFSVMYGTKWVRVTVEFTFKVTYPDFVKWFPRLHWFQPRSSKYWETGVGISIPSLLWEGPTQSTRWYGNIVSHIEFRSDKNLCPHSFEFQDEVSLIQHR